VRLIEVGSKRPELLDAWPGPGVEDRAYHLLAGELWRDRQATDRGRTATSFTYDPADPTPAVGGALLEPMGSGPRDNRGLESRPDVVTFDSPPLAEPLVIRGRPRVSLAFGSDRPATCVFLRLCDAAPDGRSTNLTDLMVPLRAGDRGAEGDWNVDVALRPVAARLEPGHRLRLQISSGAFPRFARHPGTTEPIAVATTYLPAHQTIHHSLARPGRITVPVARSQKGLNQ
jgi:putative CocE/NonD family hydrolase